MRTKPLTILISIIVSSAMLYGCGGGGQDSGGQGDANQGGASNGNKGAETETTKGLVTKINLEKNRISVRPGKDEKPVPFVFKTEDVDVRLDGKAGKPEDLEKGQRVGITYVVASIEKDGEQVERNIARTVSINTKGGGGGETTS